MGAQLLVRLYNVGLGDCIYLRVPDLEQDVHILIDCGNKFGTLDLLGECINQVKEELPEAAGGKRRLDLLVVSHPHEDHHKGFEEAFFKDIQIERIWLSPAFNRLDPKAQAFQALKTTALRALFSLSNVALGDMKEQVEELLSLSKDEAVETLCHKLPRDNGIEPLYVTADTSPGELKLFEDPAIQLKVIGPMGNIDDYYLGGDGLVNIQSGAGPQGMAEAYQALYQDPSSVPVELPKNISLQDFNQLRGRIHANALAAAELAGHAENNLSVILLLEWHGRRLLFPGDAEWNGAANGEVRAGKSNGSWNVMWKERKEDLSKPLDFLKIGHHGSENATPWTPKDHSINEILDKLLPKPVAGESPQAYAVASTQRTARWPSIPNAELLAEIGKRVANSRTEYIEQEGPKSVKPLVPQPQRTDLEDQVTGAPVPYIELLFNKVIP
jgi:beta-lactamase superfamily II metal-dependent hydrolase